MNKKFKTHYLKPTFFEPKDHWLVGIEWPVKGSKGNEYNVLLTDKGFQCECVGFSYYGKCKHSKAVLDKVRRAMA